MTPKQKKKTLSKAKAPSVKPKQSPAASPAPKAQGNLSVLVWLHAKKGKQAPLERELRALIGPTRAEPGCLVYTLHHSADRPLDFFFAPGLGQPSRPRSTLADAALQELGWTAECSPGVAAKVCRRLAGPA